MLDMVNMLACTFGDSTIQIPPAVFNVVHYVVLLIQIVVPILLIIWGMLDFAKGLTKGKDEDIKAGQKTFISRLIVAVVVFLIVTIVKLMVSLVGGLNADNPNGSNSETISGCLDCFINGADKCNG